MALISGTYKVKGTFSGFKIERSGFEKLVFSESSKEPLDRPAAALFAASQGGPDEKFVLPSMRQEAAVRMEVEGVDLANNYRSSRNVEVYVRLDDGNFYRVVYDAPDSNLILVPEFCEQVRDSHKSTGRFTGKRSDAGRGNDLSRLVNHMIDNGRKVPVFAKSPVEYSTNPNKDTKAPFFGSAPGPVAELGDLAVHYATDFLLGEHRIEKAYEWALTEDALRKLGVNQDTFAILAGGLGGGDYYGIDGLVAGIQFDSNGWARGVSQSAKFSTGNEG